MTWTQINDWLTDEKRKFWKIEIVKSERKNYQPKWRVSGIRRENGNRIGLNEGIGDDLQESLSDFINNNGD